MFYAIGDAFRFIRYTLVSAVGIAFDKMHESKSNRLTKCTSKELAKSSRPEAVRDEVSVEDFFYGISGIGIMLITIFLLGLWLAEVI